MAQRHDQQTVQFDTRSKTYVQPLKDPPALFVHAAPREHLALLLLVATPELIGVPHSF